MNFDFLNFQVTSDGTMTYIKSVLVFDMIQSFVVETFFIWDHFIAKIFNQKTHIGVNRKRMASYAWLEVIMLYGGGRESWEAKKCQFDACDTATMQ